MFTFVGVALESVGVCRVCFVLGLVCIKLFDDSPLACLVVCVGVGFVSTLGGFFLAGFGLC